MIGNEQLKFAIYLVHILAEAWKSTPSKVYGILNSTAILDKYVIPCFDVLHSLGREALVDDLTSFVREKGVAV